MSSDQKIRNAFTGVRKDLVALSLELQNRTRYLEYLLSEQKVRTQEAERRLAQMERLAVRETMIR